MWRISLLITVLFLAATGCSNIGNQAVVPTIPNDSKPVSYNSCPQGRYILAMGTIQIDTDCLKATFLPDREALKHYDGNYDVTPFLIPPYCTDCLIIEVIEYKPGQKYIKLKISLRNPTKFTVYDVKGIIVTDVPGMRLLNADSYTSIWDNVGDIKINPFKAFATDWPQREAIPGGSHARMYEIEYPALADLLSVKFVVDASWPDNCNEPYEIRNAHATGPFIHYEPEDIKCEVLTWYHEVYEVVIDLTCLGLDDKTVMVKKEGDWWAVEGVSWHEGGYGPGTYRALVSACTAAGYFGIYNYVTITLNGDYSTGWARNWGGIDWLSPNCIASHNSGYIYATGNFEGTGDFAPGLDVDERVSNGFIDAYLCKYDETGGYHWVRTWGSDGYDSGMGVTVDSSGDIIVSGTFTGTVDFDPGPGFAECSSNGHYDVFLCKFDPTGELEWVVTWGGGWDDYGSRVDTTMGDNILVTGRFGDTVDFDPSPETEIRTSNGERDVFLCSFDPDGNFQWVRTWGGAGTEYGSDLKVDAFGDVLVTGIFEEIVDFDTGPGSYESDAGSYSGAYLSKFHHDGDFQWARTWALGGGSIFYRNECNGVAVDNAGNAYVIGTFISLADFDPGDGEDKREAAGLADIFLSKFDTDGNYLGVSTWGWVDEGDGDYYTDWDRGVSVAVDDAGNVYTTGRFIWSVDLDPGPEVDYHAAIDLKGIFLSKFNPSGEYQWGRTLDGIYSQYAATGILNDIYISGIFQDTVDFQPGPGMYELTSTGSSDAFLAKYSPEGWW